MGATVETGPVVAVGAGGGWGTGVVVGTGATVEAGVAAGLTVAEVVGIGAIVTMGLAVGCAVAAEVAPGAEVGAGPVVTPGAEVAAGPAVTIGRVVPGWGVGSRGVEVAVVPGAAVRDGESAATAVAVAAPATAVAVRSATAAAVGAGVGLALPQAAARSVTERSAAVRPAYLAGLIRLASLKMRPPYVGAITKARRELALRSSQMAKVAYELKRASGKWMRCRGGS